MVVQQAYTASTSSSSSGRAVSVFVLSPSTQSQRQFHTSTRIHDVKSKLEHVTGIAAAAQTLVLQDGSQPASEYELKEGATIALLDDDDRTLAEYGVHEDGYIIKVTPSDSTLTSTLYSFVENPNVKRFELTDEEYAQRRDTVMAYKVRNKIGRFASPPPAAPSSSSTSSGGDRGTAQGYSLLPEGLQVGARVRVDLSSSGLNIKLGTVRYVGETKFAKGGIWVGVEYDEPVGKNDGSIDGHAYFACRMKYGGFVRPEKCIPGDWEPEEIFDTDDEVEAPEPAVVG